MVSDAQRSVQEVLGLAEKNTRSSVEVMKKAADAIQSPGIVESQTKWMDFWATWLGAARSNAEAMMQIGGYLAQTRHFRPA